MQRDPPTSALAHTLHVKIGRFFEARASGWGVAIVPLLLAAVLAAAIGFLTSSPG